MAKGATQLKIYIYIQDASKINDKIRTKISETARNVFKTNENISVFIINGMPLRSGEQDFYCVIDGKIVSEALIKKKNFLKCIEALLSKELGTQVYGTAVLETDHIPLKVSQANNMAGDEEFDFQKRAGQFKAVEPFYTFDRVILPDPVLDKIEETLNVIKYENKVFNEWGLSVIQPYPSSAMSFFGPSGTGKTMAAEAVASKLGKKILKASYADIESKFQGEGPKMVKAIFMAAQNEDAVLFIDEADSLLSKRLTNVTQGSEQAINSMRSQLLICLEQFHGIVIFATNLVVNYDQAFLTRLISVEFLKPDISCRKRIWDVHIKSTNGNKLNIPLADDVNTQELAEQFEFCGREIKKAVISACVNAAMNNKELVSQDDFKEAANRIIYEEKSLKRAADYTCSVCDEKKQ